MIQFSLEGEEFIPLCDLLKVTSICESGGQAKALISSELVFVDGEIETRKRCKIRAGQKVTFEDQTVLITK